MRFAVVMVNYSDSWDMVSTCLSSLRESARQSGNGLEAVVVDNDAVSTRGGGLGAQVIRNGRNLGFSRAVNRGIAASSGDFVILINPDSTVEADFFERLEKSLRAAPGVGVAGPRILDKSGELQLSARREVSMVSGLLGRTSLLTSLLPESRFVRGQFPAATATAPTSVDWVSGACMVVRREVLEEVGPLDERFFMYFEDADLCRRVRGAGYEVRYLPDVRIVHDAGGSTRDGRRAIMDLHRSAFLYHRKYGPHGPFGLLSAAVLAGLAVRALVRLLTAGR